MPEAAARLQTAGPGLLDGVLRIAGALTRTNVTIGLTVILYLVPPLVDIASNERRAYGYLAPDAFYYLTVGVNWIESGFPTFDQAHATNGFHPLWQCAVALLYRMVLWVGGSRLDLVPVSAVVCLLCISAALIFLGKAMARGGRLSPWFVLLPVGAYSFVISPAWWSSRARNEHIPLFCTLWSFANGLESALVILTYAVVVWLYVRRPVDSPKRAFILGSALGLMSLARLDHAIFPVVIVAAMILRALWQERVSDVHLGAEVGATWAIWLGTYLLYNRLSVGQLMPVSGSVKSTFPFVTKVSLDVIAQFRGLEIRSWLYQLGRIGSITVSASIALLYLLLALAKSLDRGGPFRVDKGDRFGEMLIFTALGTIPLAVYDLLFVKMYHLGQWYVPVPVLLLSLLAIELARLAGGKLRGRYTPVFDLGLGVALAGAGLIYFSRFQRVLGWGDQYANLCLVWGPNAAAHYGPNPPKIISKDDGVVAFGTGFPATSGTLLTADPAAEAAWRAGHFWELLRDRGVDHIAVLNSYYADVAAAAVGKPSDELRAYAETVVHGPLSGYDVEAEYTDGSLAVLRVRAMRSQAESK
jgi:hypothetical protein